VVSRRGGRARFARRAAAAFRSGGRGPAVLGVDDPAERSGGAGSSSDGRRPRRQAARRVVSTAPAVALQMLTPASPSAVVATKVSNHVNKVKHDDPAHCTSGSGAARLPVLENSGSAGSRLGDGRHTGRLSDPARKLPSLSRDPRSNRQPTALWMHVRCPENGGVRC
jgi:hypothetical protein